MSKSNDDFFELDVDIRLSETVDKSKTLKNENKMEKRKLEIKRWQSKDKYDFDVYTIKIYKDGELLFEENSHVKSCIDNWEEEFVYNETK